MSTSTRSTLFPYTTLFRSIANLKVFESEPVSDRIAAIERIHRERLAAFRDHPRAADVRMLGTIAAVELRADDAGYLSNLRTRSEEHTSELQSRFDLVCRLL